MEPLKIDASWTLFLDRDGVLNKNIEGSYVLDWEQFEFLPGVLEILPEFAKLFQRIIIVTNQQCIGKGLLTETGLEEIHTHMLNLITLNGGRVDAVYFAPGLENEQNLLRKPKPGMALLAQKNFPEINFQHAVMVGDKDSDIVFGKTVGMTTFYLSNSCEINLSADYQISTLKELLTHLK